MEIKIIGAVFLLCSVMLFACSKSNEDILGPVSLAGSSKLTGIDNVKAGVIGTWASGDDQSQYIQFNSDGTRCIGYSPDEMEICMGYDIKEENGAYTLYIFPIGTLTDVGSYCMVATISKLTVDSLHYRSTAPRMLHRIM